jgi:hypothetical protein
VATIKEPSLGDVFTFTVRRRHALSQIVHVGQRSGRRTYQFVVFDGFYKQRPALADVAGKALYIGRTPPRNQPFYFETDELPPAAFHRLGTRPVALAFKLPTTFRTSPRAGDDTCPVQARWIYAPWCLGNDFRSKGPPPEPYVSTHFPEWTVVDPPVLRKIDALIDAFGEQGVAGPARALKATVRAFNRIADHIDTPSAEELFEKLCAMATAAGMPDDEAARLIDAARSW